jgi:uncharacterized protein (UPF0262 family)
MPDPSSETSPESCDAAYRLASVTCDEASLSASTPDQAHERAIAIYDLLEKNFFKLLHGESGPYTLHISLFERKLVLDIRRTDHSPLMIHMLSLTPLRRIIRDYEMVCESYYAAIRSASPSQIEAIDMGRRGLHNEAADILIERLKEKITLDFDTARRLFTLIFALHWKG